MLTHTESCIRQRKTGDRQAWTTSLAFLFFFFRAGREKCVAAAVLELVASGWTFRWGRTGKPTLPARGRAECGESLEKAAILIGQYTGTPAAWWSTADTGFCCAYLIVKRMWTIFYFRCLTYWGVIKCSSHFQAPKWCEANLNGAKTNTRFLLEDISPNIFHLYKAGVWAAGWSGGYRCFNTNAGEATGDTHHAGKANRTIHEYWSPSLSSEKDCGELKNT